MISLRRPERRNVLAAPEPLEFLPHGASLRHELRDQVVRRRREGPRHPLDRRFQYPHPPLTIAHGLPTVRLDSCALVRSRRAVPRVYMNPRRNRPPARGFRFRRRKA